MPHGLFDYHDIITPMGASPIQCPNGAKAILTTFKDPSLKNRDIGFGKGINGSFKCPPPCAPTMRSGNCNYRLV